VLQFVVVFNFIHQSVKKFRFINKKLNFAKTGLLGSLLLIYDAGASTCRKQAILKNAEENSYIFILVCSPGCINIYIKGAGLNIVQRLLRVIPFF